jgi:hypothetical protein
MVDQWIKVNSTLTMIVYWMAYCRVTAYIPTSQYKEAEHKNDFTLLC